MKKNLILMSFLMLSAVFAKANADQNTGIASSLKLEDVLTNRSLYELKVIRELTKSQTKEDLVIELYNLSVKYKKDTLEFERNVKETALSSHRDEYKECYKTEKAKMEKEKRELELKMQKLKYCYEQPLPR